MKDRVFLVNSFSDRAGRPERMFCFKSPLRYSSGLSSGEYDGR
jgi:hypothetical protein